MQTNHPNCHTYSDRHQILIIIKEAFIKAGFETEQLEEKTWFILDSDEGEIRIPIELLVYFDLKPAILVKCISGSLTTRERASLSMARLLTIPPIPFAVVANEKDVIVMETITGKIIGYGYDSLPAPKKVKGSLDQGVKSALSAEQKEREKRILCTYYHLRCGGSSEPF